MPRNTPYGCGFPLPKRVWHMINLNEPRFPKLLNHFTGTDEGISFRSKMSIDNLLRPTKPCGFVAYNSSCAASADKNTSALISSDGALRDMTCSLIASHVASVIQS